ncbi:MAG: hypothetical protein AAGA09_03140 [Pseudomonadota bacterium]
MDTQDNETLPPTRNVLTLDMEKYLGQLTDWDITEEQKIQFIESLWALLVSFAEVGFEIHPVQSVLESSQSYAQKTPETPENTALSRSFVLQSKPIITTQINDKDGSIV